MKVRVFAIFDKKAKMYASPYFLPEDAQAIRAFGDLVTDPKSSIFAHPEDFSLYRLSFFDDCSGCFGQMSEDGSEVVAVPQPPVFLSHATDFDVPVSPVSPAV